MTVIIGGKQPKGDKFIISTTAHETGAAKKTCNQPRTSASLSPLLSTECCFILPFILSFYGQIVHQNCDVCYMLCQLLSPPYYEIAIQCIFLAFSASLGILDVNEISNLTRLLASVIAADFSSIKLRKDIANCNCCILSHTRESIAGHRLRPIEGL